MPLNNTLTVNSKRNQFVNWSHDSFDSTGNFSHTGVTISSRIHFNNSPSQELHLQLLNLGLLAPVPEKTISANRGLNPANRGIKFGLWLDCVPQNTISTIPGIK